MKALIVDDNVPDRKILRANLEHHGYEVIEAEDGQAGLEEAHRQKPDLIISDALMPKMDGFQFLRAVKNEDPLKSIPFVFYSAVYTGYKEAELAIALGAEAFIIKPKDPEEFWTELCDVLDDYHQQKEKPLAPKLIEQEKEYLTKYSHIVATKLEETVHKLTREIEERKKAEEALWKTTCRLESLVKAAPLAIISLDTQGMIASWNEAAERMFGWDAEEVIGKPNPIIAPEKRDEYQALHEQMRKKEYLPMLEVVRRKKDGSNITISLSAAILRNEDGTVSGSMAVIMDLTDLKKLEDQLRQAQKMEAIGQLAGGVAHDFNNILSAIIGYGHLLLMKTRGDDPQKHTVEHILEAADRAACLTHSLLAFSRKQVMVLAPANLHEIIKKVQQFLMRLIGEDVKLDTKCIGEPVFVLADSGQIEQLLMNLATNARDAMPKGGSLTIGIETIQLDEEFTRTHGYGSPGVYAMIWVSDSGVGMDEKTREKIFDPFFTTKEEGKGTGLGLAIVYGIVKQHNGYINVYSESGKGTTFKIYLPVVKTPAGEKPAEAPSAYPAGGTETILVAEDDAALRKLTSVVLSSSGYTVIAAEDGEDAVNKFLENKDAIRLLLFDIIMPKKNGREAYEEIRKIRPDVKVLFASGYTSDVMWQRGGFTEGREFILKPIVPKVLLKKVREVLDKNG